LNRHLALLHTAASNVDVFETARRKSGLPGLTLSHHVRAGQRRRRGADLFDARPVGGRHRRHPGGRRPRRACRAEWRPRGRALRHRRHAGSDWRPVPARGQGDRAQVKVRLVSGAWLAFKAGDTDRYLQIVARYAAAAFGEGADVLALAQASMAGAALRRRDGPDESGSGFAGSRRRQGRGLL